MTLMEMAFTLFGPGGKAAVLIYLMLVAVVGWLLSYIAQAAGQGTIAGMIKTTGLFICIALVANVAWDAIKVVGRIAGFK